MSFFGNRNSFGGSGGFNTGLNQTMGSQNMGAHCRMELPDPPQDSVSAIAWSQYPPGQGPKWKTNTPAMQLPQQQRVAVASWDGSVRIYDVRFNGDQQAPQAQAAAMLNIQGPCLDVALDTGGLCFTAGADGSVKMHDINTKQVKDLGKHDGPCTCIQYEPDSQLVISGGVDGYIRAFNGQGNCVHQGQLSGLIRALDARNGFLAALCSDNSVHVVNMQTNDVQVINEEKLGLTHLQHTSVTILCKEDNPRDKSRKQIQGLIVGAIDGRCSVFALNPPQTNRYSTNKGFDTYNFASHPTTVERKNTPDITAFPVNAIDSTHKGTICTAGGDGFLRFWDVIVKKKHADLEIPNRHPVIAAKFDPFSRMICFATSYDWSAGVAGHNGSIPPKVYLSSVKGIHDALA